MLSSSTQCFFFSHPFSSVRLKERYASKKFFFFFFFLSFFFFVSKLAGKEDYQWRDKIDSRRFDNRLLAIALNARWYIVDRPKSWLTLLSIFTPFSFCRGKIDFEKINK